MNATNRFVPAKGPLGSVSSFHPSGIIACAAWSLTLKARTTRLSMLDPTGVLAFKQNGVDKIKMSASRKYLAYLIMMTSLVSTTCIHLLNGSANSFAYQFSTAYRY